MACLVWMAYLEKRDNLDQWVSQVRSFAPEFFAFGCLIHLGLFTFRERQTKNVYMRERESQTERDQGNKTGWGDVACLNTKG